MSEYVEGLSKEELYRIHLNRVNSDYDRKLEKNLSSLHLILLKKKERKC